MRNLFFFLIIFFGSLEADGLRYKLYCFYTPLYRSLYERFFLPSLKDDFEVIATEFEQECLSANYKTEGWNKTMYRKLEVLREAILEHFKEQIFFYSDIDIIFLKPLLESSLLLMGEHDLAVQQGWPSEKICAGFMIIKGNSRTLKMIDMALYLMEKEGGLDDQNALRIVLESMPKEELSWVLLPSLQYPNGRRALKGYQPESFHLYKKGALLDIDPSIVLFHANCCIGLEDKIDFILRVQNEYEKIGKNYE